MPLRFSLLLLLLAACGDGGAADPPAPGNVSVTAKGDGSSVVVRTDQGSATVRTGDVAAALPQGFALYPGAQVTASTIVTPEGARRGSALLSFTSTDKREPIAAFYRLAATRAGYRVESEVTMPDMTMLGGKRADGSDFSLTLVPTAGGTDATLNTGSVVPETQPSAAMPSK